MNAGRGGVRVDAAERKGRAHARTASIVLRGQHPFPDHCSCCESGLCEGGGGEGRGVCVGGGGWGTQMGRRRGMLIDVAGGQQDAEAAERANNDISKAEQTA